MINRREIDIKHELPIRGSVKTVEVIVARNRRSTGNDDWSQDILEVYTIEGTLIAVEDRQLGCETSSDVIQDAIDIIGKLLEAAAKTGTTPDIGNIIDKLNALIIY